MIESELCSASSVSVLSYFQIMGMGTALKILFSGDSMGPLSTVTREHRKSRIPFQLTRGEIVSLFNAFGRQVVIVLVIKQVDSFKNPM